MYKIAQARFSDQKTPTCDDDDSSADALARATAAGAAIPTTLIVVATDAVILDGIIACQLWSRCGCDIHQRQSTRREAHLLAAATV